MSVNVEVSEEIRGLREENRTLYDVIKLVSSSLEMSPMLAGVVDLATEATGCHACFIYLLEDGRLTIRAASPVFAAAVDKVSFSIDEGLTGWVARHRTPEFIRDGAMEDPRMKFVPLLDEERFQSMVAVPILARNGDTIGVIVLHTQAPHEFTEDAVKLLVHIASLVSGAIENAQLYDRERSRVDALTDLSGLAQQVAAAADAGELGPTVADGARRVLGAEVCQLYRLDEDGDGLQLLASSPREVAIPESMSEPALLLAALEGRGHRPPARSLWPELAVGDVLVTPMSVGGERVGLLCAGSVVGGAFGEEDTEIARAIAHLSAIALKRAELIQGLTNANIVKDLFEALSAGATSFAATKAAEIRCDLSSPYLLVHAEPAAGREAGSGAWREAAETIGRELAALAGTSAVEAGPGPVRALLALGVGRSHRVENVFRTCRELGQRHGAALGVSELRECPGRRGPGLSRGAGRGDDRPGAARRWRRDPVRPARRLPLPRPHRPAGRAPRPDAGRRRPADRLRHQAPNRAARHARALPGRTAIGDRERAGAVHPPEHAAPAARPDRGADRAQARRGRSAVAGAGDQAGPAARAPWRAAVAPRGRP